MKRSKTSVKELKEQIEINNFKKIKSIPNLKDMKETDYSRWLCVTSKYKKLLNKEKKK